MSEVQRGVMSRFDFADRDDYLDFRHEILSGCGPGCPECGVLVEVYEDGTYECEECGSVGEATDEMLEAAR